MVSLNTDSMMGSPKRTGSSVHNSSKAIFLLLSSCLLLLASGCYFLVAYSRDFASSSSTTSRGVRIRAATAHRSLHSTNYTSVLCHVTTLYTSYENASNADEEELQCILLDETRKIVPIQLPESIKRRYEASSSEDNDSQPFVVHITHASVNGYNVQTSKASVFTWVDESHSALVKHHIERHRELVRKTSRTFAVLRLSTSDLSPGPSLQDLHDLFHPTEINLKTQFEACSFGAFQVVKGPVLDVRIPRVASSFRSASELVQEAEEYVLRERRLSHMTQLADHVMFCIPAGIPDSRGDWTATGMFHNYRTTYNNEYCLSLAATMHELGHNLGLKHSGVPGNKYGDGTGTMGSSPLTRHGPQRCFNAVKNWKLGWYNDRSLKLSHAMLLNEGPVRVDLAAFVYKQETTSDEPVIINIANKLYVQYNLARSFNVGTRMLRNQVVITAKGDGHSETVGGLLEDEVFRKRNFHGQTLTIRACHGEAEEPFRMSMVIGYGRISCPTREQSARPVMAPRNQVSTDTVFPTVEGQRHERAPRRTPAPTPRPSPYLSPTWLPTPEPTPYPTPSSRPTHRPTTRPTVFPTLRPTRRPTPRPTPFPTPRPSPWPTPLPTPRPTADPTPQPVFITSRIGSPTMAPPQRPSVSSIPSSSPSDLPSVEPSRSFRPTIAPVTGIHREDLHYFALFFPGGVN